MGKANRVKTEKATNVLAGSYKRKNTKKGMPTWAGTVIVIAVVVLLAAFAIVMTLNSRGVFKRASVMAETDHFKVTVPMMSYMLYTQRDAAVAQYQQYAAMFGQSSMPVPAADKTGTALDTSVALRDQIYQVKTNADGSQTTITWFDHFGELAVKDFAWILACCEDAYQNGVELDKQDKLDIDESLEDMEEYANSEGYTLSTYITLAYGSGVTKKDVRNVLEISTLADKYSKICSDSFVAAIPDEKVQSQYDSSPSKYNVFIDYIGYTFTTTFDPIDTSAEGAAATNADKQAKYEADQAKYATYAAELYATETAADFAKKLLLILTEMFTEEEKDALLAKKEAGATLTAEELQICSNNAQTRALAAVEKADNKNFNTGTNTGDTVLHDWLTSADPVRKADDKMKDEAVYDVYGNKLVNGEKEESATGTTYTDATSSYSVYFAKSAPRRAQGVTQNVGHILFSSSYDTLKDTSELLGETKELADRVLARGGKLSAKEMAIELTTVMMEDGVLTQTTNAAGETIYTISEEDFRNYAREYNEDSGWSYDNVCPGDMVAEFENWLFAGNHVEGEMSYPGGVDTDYGCHIMLYRGAGEQEAWKYKIRTELAEADYKTWKTAVEATYTVTYGDVELWDLITG